MFYASSGSADRNDESDEWDGDDDNDDDDNGHAERFAIGGNIQRYINEKFDVPTVADFSSFSSVSSDEQSGTSQAVMGNISWRNRSDVAELQMSGNVSNAMLTQFIPLLVQSRLPQVVNINELIFQNNSVDQKHNRSEIDTQGDEEGLYSKGDCRLLVYDKLEDKIRIIAELGMEIGSVLYILAALREAKFLGIQMFIENLVS
ncbi:hypothetical protein RUM43_013896 [Polyplax serrata]|uniref:Uncharacterized protein n=1 Tax=Polyplax serrata TaxID=468196 RepID=A0AAN8P4T4_POLSC